LLNTLAFLSAFVMGAYCILLLFTNNMLPKRIRPKMWTNVALGAAACLYLGGIAASLILYGALPD
jgi:tellurite resistance protein TehA-like permease